MTKIKFGTDGWRALIARDFTFDTVTKVAQAVANTMAETSPNRKTMIVGYDRRFLSRDFAQTAAVIYARAGFQVLFADTFVPTPTLSWWAKNGPEAVGATVITASHNPPIWNGFKFKEAFGGSALPATTTAFEKQIEKLDNLSTPSADDFSAEVKKGKIELINLLPKYLEAMLKQVDLESIRKAKPRVLLDVMHGAASGNFHALLRDLSVSAYEMHGEDNPGFRGVAPEPVAKNLKDLCAAVRAGGFACGLATDGDADRLGAVDEEGNYFTTQQILSVVYWHMLNRRKKAWSIARSVSTTRMVDLIAQRAGFACHETPVGFKFIAEKMVAGEAQIGGEESGGIGIMDHIPERDGLLTGLLLLELIATSGEGLKAAYEKLCRQERPYYFIRYDIRLPEDTATSAMTQLTTDPPMKWDKRDVEHIEKTDGFKFYLKDGSWLLIRKSGTEPIFRIYAETESTSASRRMVEAAKAFIENR